VGIVLVEFSISVLDRGSKYISIAIETDRNV
jgi:hypothetical protein